VLALAHGPDTTRRGDYKGLSPNSGRYQRRCEPDAGWSGLRGPRGAQDRHGRSCQAPTISPNGPQAGGGDRETSAAMEQLAGTVVKTPSGRISKLRAQAVSTAERPKVMKKSMRPWSGSVLLLQDLQHRSMIDDIAFQLIWWRSTPRLKRRGRTKRARAAVGNRVRRLAQSAAEASSSQGTDRAIDQKWRAVADWWRATKLTSCWRRGEAPA
jgi:hypothetical protein